MYGDLVEKLIRRSKSFLRSSKLRIEWGDYDLALFDVEQALQLYLKATLLELFGIKSKVHGVLERLGMLRKELSKAGFDELAISVSDLVRENRAIIDMIDEAYVSSRYEVEEVEPTEALAAYDFALKVLELLERVRREVKGEQ